MSHPQPVFLNFPWALYPRRVQIFLHEKALDIETRDFDPYRTTQWPPQEVLDVNPLGKLPVLRLGEKAAFTQSLAILHYLERAYPNPSMTGSSDVESAQIMELNSLADEAYTIFSVWIYSASLLFKERALQSPEAARTGARLFAQKLDCLELAVQGPDFLHGDRVSMADCVAFPLIQFMDEFYGVQLPARFSKLRRWYQSFRSRPSVPNHDYPASLLSLSRNLKQQSGFSLEEICAEMGTILIHK